MLYRTAKRVVIAVVGGTVVLIGIIMIVAPGPAFVVIPAGLAILATEFVWAQRLLKKFKDGARHAVDRIRGGKGAETAGQSEKPHSSDKTHPQPAR